MLLKTFAIFQICLVLCQAELLTRYKSQEIVQVIMKPMKNFAMCKCANGKYALNVKAAEDLCKVFKSRFHFYGHQNPYFMLCEFDPRTCEEMNGDTPKIYIMNLYFDAYYVRRSPIYVGDATGERLVTALFKHRHRFPSPVFETMPVSVNTTFGAKGMPMEIEGVLTIKTADFSKYELCYEGACHKTINELCAGFTQELKAAYPKLMQQFLGCNVRRIYIYENKVHFFLAMMFHFDHLVASKTLQTVKDLEKVVEIASKLNKPKLVESYRVSGLTPLDFCEISATAITTEKFNETMLSPISVTYRMRAQEYYTKIEEQLNAGDSKYPHCPYMPHRLELSNENGMAKLFQVLWVSKTCWQQRGVKSCKEVVQEIDKQWKRGSQIYYNSWTPKYEFKFRFENYGLQWNTTK